MQYLKLSFIVFFFSIVVGCSSGSGDSPASTGPNPIEVKSVYTDVANLHESVFEKFGNTADRSIEFRVSIEVSHLNGVNAITRVGIQNQIADRFWDLLGGPFNVPLSECYDASRKVFDCIFYSSEDVDSIELTTWEVYVEDIDGNLAFYPFTIKKPGAIEPDQAFEFVYSAENYLGNVSSGTEALETLEIVDNEMVFQSNAGTQSFRIEFSTSDSRAQEYELLFYDSDNNYEYVGYACLCAPSIQSSPIISGQKVILDIPWSELSLLSGASVSDIDSMHVVMFDEATDWETELQSGIWFNHLSYSELITL